MCTFSLLLLQSLAAAVDGGNLGLEAQVVLPDLLQLVLQEGHTLAAGHPVQLIYRRRRRREEEGGGEERERLLEKARLIWSEVIMWIKMAPRLKFRTLLVYIIGIHIESVDTNCISRNCISRDWQKLTSQCHVLSQALMRKMAHKWHLLSNRHSLLLKIVWGDFAPQVTCPRKSLEKGRRWGLRCSEAASSFDLYFFLHMIVPKEICAYPAERTTCTSCGERASGGSEWASLP